MRVGIIQSSYVPWRGYFDFIASVDTFVLLDDVPFGSKGNWRHRNQLKLGDELQWMTVPVRSAREQPIDEVEVDPAQPEWRARHEELLRRSLGKAPFFADALRLWKEGVDRAPRRLSELNRGLTELICAYLGIGTSIRDARPLAAVGAKTERLLSLLEKLGAKSYLSGPVARDYIDEGLFRSRGIRLEYKSYDYEPYPQQGGPFIGTVSVLDLVANVGPQAARFLRSRAPDRVAVA